MAVIAIRNIACVSAMWPEAELVMNRSKPVYRLLDYRK
jgi:hypothetical protein